MWVDCLLHLQYVQNRFWCVRLMCKFTILCSPHIILQNRCFDVWVHCAFFTYIMTMCKTEVLKCVILHSGLEYSFLSARWKNWSTADWSSQLAWTKSSTPIIIGQNMIFFRKIRQESRCDFVMTYSWWNQLVKCVSSEVSVPTWNMSSQLQLPKPLSHIPGVDNHSSLSALTLIIDKL